MFHEAVLDEILEERVVSSRNRTCPRGVKRKMTRYPVRHYGSKHSTSINFRKHIMIIK